MSWDIYGNPLRRGHCEVHPHVHEEYPCSLCLSAKQSNDAIEQSRDALERLNYDLGMQDDHIKHLEAERNALLMHAYCIKTAFDLGDNDHVLNASRRLVDYVTELDRLKQGKTEGEAQ